MNLLSLPSRLRREVLSEKYIPELDGIRFLAIAPVLLFHSTARISRIAPNQPGWFRELLVLQGSGSIGVSLFFLISGFVIARPFIKHSNLDLGSYYKRRLLRIEPPYIIVMTLCFLVLALGFIPADAPNFRVNHAPLWQSYLASIFYVHGPIFGEHPKLNPPAWSLEREVQFYAIAPMLLWFYMKMPVSTRRLFVMPTLILLSIAISAYVRAYLPFQSLANQSIVSESYGFWTGILLADVMSRSDARSSEGSVILDVGLLVALGALLVSGLFEAGRSYSDSFLLGMSREAITAAVFWCGMSGKYGRRLLGSPWISLIGGACYSIYLTHVPVMEFGAHFLRPFLSKLRSPLNDMFGIGSLITLALVVGLAFYATVERFFMRRNWPRDLRRSLLYNH